MLSNFSALATRFDDLLARYEEAAAPRGIDVRDLLSRLQSGDQPAPGAFLKGMQEIGERERERFDPYSEMRAIMGELAPAYLIVSAEDRAMIRKLVSDRPKLADLIREYGESMASEIASSQDVDKLRHGLSAISIEDCRSDYRDTLTALASLFTRAEDAGIDPMPHFIDVAQLSSEETPKGGDEPMAKMLRSFDQAAVLGSRRRGQ